MGLFYFPGFLHFMDHPFFAVHKINFDIADFDLFFLPGIRIFIYEAAQLDILVFIFKLDIPGKEPELSFTDKEIIDLGSGKFEFLQNRPPSRLIGDAILGLLHDRLNTAKAGAVFFTPAAFIADFDQLGIGFYGKRGFRGLDHDLFLKFNQL